MKDKLLDIIYEYCSTCPNCLSCVENDCVLYKIEQLIIERMSDNGRESEDKQS